MHLAFFLPILAFVALSSQSPVSKYVPRNATTEPCQDVANYISSLPNSTGIVPLRY